MVSVRDALLAPCTSSVFFVVDLVFVRRAMGETALKKWRMLGGYSERVWNHGKMYIIGPASYNITFKSAPLLTISPEKSALQGGRNTYAGYGVGHQGTEKRVYNVPMGAVERVFTQYRRVLSEYRRVMRLQQMSSRKARKWGTGSVTITAFIPFISLLDAMLRSNLLLCWRFFQKRRHYRVGGTHMLVGVGSPVDRAGEKQRTYGCCGSFNKYRRVMSEFRRVKKYRRVTSGNGGRGLIPLTKFIYVVSLFDNI